MKKIESSRQSSSSTIIFWAREIAKQGCTKFLAKHSLLIWNQKYVSMLKSCLINIVFRYQQLIKDNLKEVAKLITTEQGKTLADAEGDVMRGLQVT